MNTIKAIETRYRGYRFRSRLEARWAVFFDALGEPYEYEPEGFELKMSSGNFYYLPDFRLVHHHSGGQLWIEIKPKRPFTNDEIIKFVGFTETTDNCLIVLCGEPWHDVIGYEFCNTINKGYLFSRPTKIMQCPRTIRGTKNFDESHAPHIAWLSANARQEIMDTGIKPSDADFFINRVVQSKWLMNGYLAARSARFEHGENGAK